MSDHLTAEQRALIAVQIRHQEYRRSMTSAWRMRDPENRDFWAEHALRQRDIAHSAAWILTGRRVGERLAGESPE